MDSKSRQIAEKAGFIAALDQSGGSTPSALRHYGIRDADYSDDGQMYRLMHDMRVRIITSPTFSGEKVIGAILFERTMDGMANGRPVPTYLWEDRGVVPFLKVDSGLAPEESGVQLMKPVAGLNALLQRAVDRGIYGTKMRSVINDANRHGIAAIVRQQFDLGRQILANGLIPIIEPEISINSLTKADAETILLEEVLRELDTLPDDAKVIVKLSIPTVANHYEPLVENKSVLRVVALSGGYSRADACEKLSRNRGVIASFSRALTEDLRVTMSDDEFSSSLRNTIDQIWQASVRKA